MAIKDLIQKFLLDQGFPILDFSLTEIYNAFPLINKVSLRSAITRMYNKGDLERVDKGVYEFEKSRYQLYTHSKRITDTIQSNKKKHSYDIDLEMTIKGTSNTILSEDEIDKIVNPALVKKSLEILSLEGILLIEQLTIFEVEGSEWLTGEYRDKYDESWDVEVTLTNKQANKYTFTGITRILEDEFY